MASSTPREMKTSRKIHKNVCSSIFTIDKNWKYPARQWINKCWYIHKVKYYTEMNGTSHSYKQRHVNLTNLMLRERSQTQKRKHCDSIDKKSSHRQNSSKVKKKIQDSGSSGCWEGGEQVGNWLGSG